MRQALLCAIFIVAGALLGCGDSDLGTKGGEGQGADYAAQIKAIDDNPNMPEPAKAAAKAQIEARMKQGAAGQGPSKL